MRQSREFEICAGLRGTRYQTTQSPETLSLILTWEAKAVE